MATLFLLVEIDDDPAAVLAFLLYADLPLLLERFLPLLLDLDLLYCPLVWSPLDPCGVRPRPLLLPLDLENLVKLY